MGLQDDEIDLYGRYKAKVDLSAIDRLAGSAGRQDRMRVGDHADQGGRGQDHHLGVADPGPGATSASARCCACGSRRWGPIFGIKGGAAGGGYTQVVPMEDLNLHFTGDFHAIAAANNMLAAFVDRHMFYGNDCRIDPHRVTWRRAIDMNDRHLRNVDHRAGRPHPRHPARDRLRHRGRLRGDGDHGHGHLAARPAPADRRDHGRLRRGRQPVTAEQMGCAGAMTVLLKDALKPNLIQTLEGQPCFMHIGPFGNIAHGNWSIVADLVGRKLGDYLITESGFGSDLGMEKFMDIVCRAGGFAPDAVVIVATAKALKHHAGLDDDPRYSAAESLPRDRGRARPTSSRHIMNVKEFGLPCVVAANRFPTDTDDEVELVQRLAIDFGAHAAVLNDGFAQGRRRGRPRWRRRSPTHASSPARSDFVYDEADPIDTKIEKIAPASTGADGVDFLPAARARRSSSSPATVWTGLSICMAKTHLSLSADAALATRPPATGSRSATSGRTPAPAS